MADTSEDGLEETRAALAPTLEATAAILPWVAKPRPPRFDPALNQRWIEACQRLTKAWSERHGSGMEGIRPAIFALYGIALETADADCLRLGEALAGAADQLEQDSQSLRLIAALTASIECLDEPTGLEHEVFATRARHFALRLDAALRQTATSGERSRVLDRLFADESRERIEQMRDALLALPPDAHSLKSEAGQIIHQAEHLELYGIIHLARRVEDIVTGEPDLDLPETRRRMEESLHALAEAIAAIDA